MSCALIGRPGGPASAEQVQVLRTPCSAWRPAAPIGFLHCGAPAHGSLLRAQLSTFGLSRLSHNTLLPGVCLGACCNRCSSRVCQGCRNQLLGAARSIGLMPVCKKCEHLTMNMYKNSLGVGPHARGVVLCLGTAA